MTEEAVQIAFGDFVNSEDHRQETGLPGKEENMYIPKPDIVYRPSGEFEDMLKVDAMPRKAALALSALSLDPTITDVEMRLKEVFIFDNRDPGKGDIYLVTVVADNLSQEPITLEVRTFEDIHDNEALQLGAAGLTMYRNPQGKIPRFLDYRILVSESDHEMRQAGDVVNEIRTNDQFKAVRDNLIAMAATAQPTVALITAAVDLVVGLIARILKMNRDDQIMYIAGSFNDKIDDLGVQYGLVAHKNAYARVAYQVLAA